MGSMSTDNENLPKTKSKRKPKTDKLLCTFPKCGQVKVLKEHIKKLAEEDAVLKIQLADRDACIEEMEAKLRNLLGDLYAPSSERIHLATKDGVAVEDPQAESDPLDPVSNGKKKRGAQIGHRGYGRKIPDSIPSIEVIHEIPEEKKVCHECGLSYRDLTLTEDSVEIDYEVKGLGLGRISHIHGRLFVPRESHGSLQLTGWSQEFYDHIHDDRFERLAFSYHYSRDLVGRILPGDLPLPHQPW